MNKNIITFVFQSGRTSRINNEKEEFSKEFFYSYQNFKAEFSYVNLIEFTKLGLPLPPKYWSIFEERQLDVYFPVMELFPRVNDPEATVSDGL